MIKHLLLILLMGLISLSPGVADSGAAPTNISGTWDFSLVMQNKIGGYKQDWVFVLKQQGKKITGTCNGPDGEKKVTGTVAGNRVVIEHKLSGDGGIVMRAIYKGTIETPAKLIGTADHIGDPDGIRRGKWTATKR